MDFAGKIYNIFTQWDTENVTEPLTGISQPQSIFFLSKIPQQKNFCTEKLSPCVFLQVHFETETPKQRCIHICLAHTIVNRQPVSGA